MRWRACVVLILVVMSSGCLAAPDPDATDSLEAAGDPDGNVTGGLTEWFLLTANADEDGETAGFAFTLPNGTVHAHHFFERWRQVAFEVVPILPEGSAPAFISRAIDVFIEEADGTFSEEYSDRRSNPIPEAFERPFVVDIHVSFRDTNKSTFGPGDTLRILVGAAAHGSFEFGLAVRFFEEDPRENDLMSDDLASFREATEEMQRVDVQRVGSAPTFVFAVEKHRGGYDVSPYGQSTGHMDVEVSGNAVVGYTLEASYKVELASTYAVVQLMGWGKNALGEVEGKLFVAGYRDEANGTIAHFTAFSRGNGMYLDGWDSGSGGVALDVSVTGRGQAFYMEAQAIVFGASLKDIFRSG